MYELSVACKYLLPRWRQLSVSVISVISVVVIALVVWLIVVFFSVTNGLEKYWISKFVTLAAPVRLTPTDAYYRSYYYQVDNISDASDYQPKSIGQKLVAMATDPYDPGMDTEVPGNWPAPDVDADGKLKDIVKQTYSVIQGIPGVKASNYETTFGNIRLRLVRGAQHRARNFRGEEGDQAFLAQATLIGSFEGDNPQVERALMPLSPADATNLLAMAGMSATNMQSDTADTMKPLDPQALRGRLSQLFEHLEVTQLTPAPEGWSIPRHFLPSEGTWQAVALLRGPRVVQLIVPQDKAGVDALYNTLKAAGYECQIAQVEWKNKDAEVKLADNSLLALPPNSPVTLARGAVLNAQYVKLSLNRASLVEDVLFDISGSVQGHVLAGIVPLRGLEIAAFRILNSTTSSPAHWAHRENEGGYRLPNDPAVGEGVLLPKGFKDVGVLAGDRGYVSYYTPTPSSVQEQRIPVFVAGFYDPGMIPMGGKLIFVNQKLTTMIRAAYGQQDKDTGNGIRVRFDDFTRAEQVKEQIDAGLKARGIDRYWKVETYRDYEFAKEILQQQRSDKNLFLVIAAVIIVVACSNIISMLIILVNDKKTEIGILRSMGATSRSIAWIFGTCGFVMGFCGSLIGISTAALTLRHLDSLIAFLGNLQGYEMFNPTFYGQSMPNELSLEALLFVLGATALFSLLAGVIPAIKASLVKPSATLRSE
jgi:lipoprotein-releasing system permease protein